MGQKNAEADAWAEFDEWRRFGGNTRLAFSLKQRALFAAASSVFRLVGRWITDSVCWNVEDPANVLDGFFNRGKPYVFVCWHNRLVGTVLFFGSNFCRRKKAVRVASLVSESSDGEMIARCVRDYGGENVRGSSSRRGAEGLREAVEEARRGLSLVITVDGPKGPRYELKPGALMLAKLSGVEIVPITWSCDRTLQFHRSWDQLMVPLPRSRMNVRLGRPFAVPADADVRGIARARREIEAQMREMAAQSDLETAITWQIPKPKPGERLKKRKAVVAAASKRM